MQYSDQYANIAKSMAIQSFGSNTPANLSTNGFPSGVLNGNISLTQAGLPQNYFDRFVHVSTGNAILNLFNMPPLIVYSGGNAVQSVSPSNTGVSNTGGGGISLLPNGNWNVEFAFGDLVTAVADNGSGLVRLTLSNSSSLSTYGTGAKVQVHNVTNLSPTTVWTMTKIDNTHADLQGSTYSGTMAVVGGSPGTASEMIVQVGSASWSWLQSTTGFTNANNTISSWIFCKKADLASILAGNEIRSDVISSVVTNAPAWLRFMDMSAVQASQGQFQYLPPSTYAHFQSNPGFWLPDYYGGTTAGSSDAYTVNPGPMSPTSGAYFDGELIQFTANRATISRLPTLAINGRSSGAKRVFTDQTNPTNFNLALGTASSAISSISGSGTIATATTTAPHGFVVGQLFRTNISGNTPSGFDSGNALATSTGASTFTYSNATSGSTSVAGTFIPLLAGGDIFNLTFTGSNFPSGAYTFKYYLNLATASFTATSVGKIMTVSAVSSGLITPGQQLTGASNTPRILPYGNAGTTGTGSTGTYALDVASTGGTINGATSSPGADCTGGVVSAMNTLTADLSCVMAHDPILGSQGYISGNDSNNSRVNVHYPEAINDMTPGASITSFGAAAETVVPSRGTLASGTNYTAQYRKIYDGWYVTGGPVLSGVPLSIMKEYATRTGGCIWFTIPLTWSLKSAQDFGTYMAANWSGICVGLEISNELWNIGQIPDHLAQSLGIAMGWANTGDGLYYRPIMSYQGWTTINLAQVAIDAYVAAGGARSNMTLMIQNSGADGDGGIAGGGGSQTNGGITTAWNGPLLTPTFGTFTGTITPNTNGLGATLTVTGNTGSLYPGAVLTGAGVTAGTRVSGCLPLLSFCTVNGTFQLDTAYGGTVGPVAMTATNAVYAAIGGPGFTSTSTANNAFPTRPIDYADAVGHAMYYEGGMVRAGAGTWGNPQSQYTPILQASADYAQGIATSNNTLIQSALNAWSDDLRSKKSRSGNYTSSTLCGFLSSPTTFGFCDNAAPAVFTATGLGTGTMNVSAITSGVIVPGLVATSGGNSATPSVLPYGTGGTTGTGGIGTYAMSSVLNSGSFSPLTSPIGAIQGYANYAALYDGAGRPSGRANLSIIWYEGSIQQNFCASNPGEPCVVGDIILANDTATMASRFTALGWSLDATYGYPSFGAGNSVTAANIIKLYLAYVNSTQYYNDSLFLYQSAKTISASRPFFGPAQYGVNGPNGTTATTGAPFWGLYPGDLSTAPLQNYNAQSYFNTH